MTDYTFYTEKYLLGREAVIDSASFPFYEREAANKVRKYTFGNINETKTIPDKVQECVCKVAESICASEKNVRYDGITSEKVGGYSVSYESKKSNSEALRDEIISIIYDYLANTGLLYCGGAYDN